MEGQIHTTRLYTISCLRSMNYIKQVIIWA
uniref:Uncharacterized protein n=1 Tax=Rhizophora mucronata TaxID=61149 RepID=A0A2P2NSV4_RHIMU